MSIIVSPKNLGSNIFCIPVNKVVYLMHLAAIAALEMTLLGGEAGNLICRGLKAGRYLALVAGRNVQRR
jgi:hypothetical protein